MRQINNKKLQIPHSKSTNSKSPITQMSKQKKDQQITVNINKNSQTNVLEGEYRTIKLQLIKKQRQLQSKQRMYRIEIFKNQSLKQQVQDIDKHFEITKYKITLDILQKNKDNKDSPMFYNENGLSPFQLILLEQKKHQTGFQEVFLCMVCFQDIEENQTIIQLPCDDSFHKDCIIQHLLGSKICPNCNLQVDVKSSCQSKIKKQQKLNKIQE